MGKAHIEAYQAADVPCRLVAVADRSQERRTGRRGAGGNFDIGTDGPLFDAATVTGYADADELFADPAVDVVSITTPTDTHVPLAIAALQAGKHVLVEKPLAVDSVDVGRLAAVAAESNRLCMPAMCMRHWPGWTWLIDRIGDQSLGRLKSMTLERVGARPEWNVFYADPSRSGGALLDLHVHDSDFLVAALGLPLTVTSVGTLDSITSCYHFADVDRVVAHGAWLTPGTPFRMRYLAEFDEATADFDLARDPPLLLCRDGEAEAVELPSGTGYDGEIRHFLGAVATGGEASPTVADAVKTHQLIDAERRSLQEQRKVPL
jgi:predicted dehydrogenase